MNVHRVIKNASGNFEFQGEVTQDEFDIIFDAGLATLLAAGALAVDSEEEFDD